MGRGGHPRRTPVYGAVLILSALLVGVAVTRWIHPPVAVRVIVLVIAVCVALVGVVMTLRDYT